MEQLIETNEKNNSIAVRSNTFLFNPFCKPIFWCILFIIAIAYIICTTNDTLKSYGFFILRCIGYALFLVVMIHYTRVMILRQ